MSGCDRAERAAARPRRRPANPPRASRGRVRRPRAGTWSTSCARAPPRCAIPRTAAAARGSCATPVRPPFTTRASPDRFRIVYEVGPLGIATRRLGAAPGVAVLGLEHAAGHRSRRARLHRDPRHALRHRAARADARPAAARDRGDRPAARRGRSARDRVRRRARARADRPLCGARLAVLDRRRRRRRRHARVPRRLAGDRRAARPAGRAARDTAERRAARGEDPRRARGGRRRARHRRRVRGRCGVRRSAGGARRCPRRCTSTAARAGAARSRSWRASRAPIASRWRRANCARAATRWSSPREGPRVLWGDLHGHSAFSDGTGLPEDYFVYARDVSALDVVALTDHDHWGILPLAEHPELWNEIRAQTRRFHAPGRFVTLLGFEWTSWIHGHRHVLYFGDDGPRDRFGRRGHRHAGRAVEGARRPRGAHDSAPSGGRPDRDRLGGRARPALRAGGRDRLDPRQQRGARLAGRDPRAGRGPLRARRARARLPARLHRQRRPPRRPPGRVRDAIPPRAASRRSSPRSARARACCARCASGASTRPTARGSCCASALGGTPIGGVVPLAAGARRARRCSCQVIGSAPLERIEVVRSGAVVDGARARRASSRRRSRASSPTSPRASTSTCAWCSATAAPRGRARSSSGKPAKPARSERMRAR